MTRRLFALLLLLALAAVTATQVGCAKKLTGTMGADQPPHTYLFVQGPVDTVNHVVHFYWYGTDADGYVTGYEYKLANPLDTVAADSAWRYTARTDSVFTIVSPNGAASPVFSVRAIDDKGLRDPNPASNRFLFRNHPPIVLLTAKPNRNDHSDTTYAAVTVTYSISDPDGNTNAAKFHLWIDSLKYGVVTTTARTYTVPTSVFYRNGDWISGKHTLYVQAEDDGGMLGNVDSVAWSVRRPVAGRWARVLYIDHTTSAKAAIKNMYLTALHAAGVADSNIAYLDRTTISPFKSSQDVAQTFGLFDAVVISGGVNNTFTNYASGPTYQYLPDVGLYEDGIAAYLNAGGRVYIESLNLTWAMTSAQQPTPGALTPDFLARYANCLNDGEGVVLHSALPNASAAWGVNNPTPLTYTHLVEGPDGVFTGTENLTNVGSPSGLRGFEVRDTTQVLGIVDANLAQPNPPGNPNPLWVAINVRQPNPAGDHYGRLILNTYPLPYSLNSAGSRTTIAVADIMKIIVVSKN